MHVCLQNLLISNSNFKEVSYEEPYLPLYLSCLSPYLRSIRHSYFHIHCPCTVLDYPPVSSVTSVLAQVLAMSVFLYSAPLLYSSPSPQFFFGMSFILHPYPVVMFCFLFTSCHTGILSLICTVCASISVQRVLNSTS